MLSLEDIQEVLDYNPESGLLVWKKRTSSRANAGDIAGCRDRDGYLLVRYKKVLMRVHRVAFLFMTGSWPSDEVDHINGDRSDNRWSNLRIATRLNNCHNLKTFKTNTTGFKGVYFHKKWGRYVARVSYNGVLYQCGNFATAEEAFNARNAKARELHGEFFNEG